MLYRGITLNSGVGISASSPLLNYGQGFFETILYEGGCLRHYSEHVERMRRTCGDFGITLDFSQIAEPLILHYLGRIGLGNRRCRVKILYAPVEEAARWDTMVFAVPYTRPTGEAVLSIHGEVYDSNLNRYKSLNRQYNNYWKEFYEKKEKSDEVLFRGSRGGILEGSFTNILCRRASILYYVDGDNPYLRGITQDKILEEAKKIGGITIKPLKEGMDPDRLGEADEVMLCNSLVTVWNVKKIFHGGRGFTWPSPPPEDCLGPVLRRKILG